MKVLEKGRKQTGWAAERICTGSGNGGGGCGAKLLVEQADVFRTESNHLGETERFNTFRCPECRVLTDIDGVPFTPAGREPNADTKDRGEK